MQQYAAVAALYGSTSEEAVGCFLPTLPENADRNAGLDFFGEESKTLLFTGQSK